jgi:ribosome maturation protein SDO1
MSSKFTVGRLVLDGERFEVLVNPDPALEFKMGRPVSMEKVLASDVIYSDASKGLRASAEKLRRYFRTEVASEVAAEILRRGELQITAEQRRRLIEDKRRQIVAFIAKNYVDPGTGLPHPITRIEQALEEAKASIDPFRPAEEQAKAVIERLRAILPLKMQRVKLRIRVPAAYAAQSFSALKSMSDLLQSEWGQDGSLTALVEVAPGGQQALLDRLGSITKGGVQVTVEK